jgi:hypothetical protein
MKPREVELPVCPQCGHVGKRPAGNYKGYCIGKAGQNHKRLRMTPVRFREIREPTDA